MCESIFDCCVFFYGCSKSWVCLCLKWCIYNLWLCDGCCWSWIIFYFNVDFFLEFISFYCKKSKIVFKNRRNYLFYDFYCFCFDGVCWFVLLRDVGRIYIGLLCCIEFFFYWWSKYWLYGWCCDWFDFWSGEYWKFLLNEFVCFFWFIRWFVEGREKSGCSNWVDCWIIFYFFIWWRICWFDDNVLWVINCSWFVFVYILIDYKESGEIYFGNCGVFLRVVVICQEN